LAIVDFGFALRSQSAIRNQKPAIELRVGLRFAQTRDAIAGFALTAFFEKRRAFKTLEDIALAAQRGRRAQTAML
jgi:hypothetical protein